VRAVLDIEQDTDGRHVLDRRVRTPRRPGYPKYRWLGVALYNERDVRIYREPEPAGDSAWLSFIKRQRLPGRLMLSHLRHATQGAVSFVNTQPFARELGGHMHVFAHNGRFDGIETGFASEWGRFQPIGNTDSEVAFCILLERLSVLWRGGVTPPLVHRLAIVSRFAAQMRELGPANFLYADGDVLFAHGDRRLQANGEITPPGLWRLRRECTTDPDASPRAGVVTGAGGPHQEITLIASVPLNAERWMPLAEGEVIVVKDGAACSPSRADGRAGGRSAGFSSPPYQTKESRGEVPPYHQQ
jgi:glutamine amidotransferase